MTSPLAFTFRIDPPHRATGIAALRIAAATRVALLGAGIERLGELEGLSAARLAALPRVGPPGALSLVRAVRWRCVHGLASWHLLRDTTVARLPAPLNRLPPHAGSPLYAAERVTASASAMLTLSAVFAAGPEAVARRTTTPVREVDLLFDQLARIAELEPDSLRRVSAFPDPFLLPVIHPLVIVAAARAQTEEERIAALALGLSRRDSLILLMRWGFGEAPRPTCGALAVRFGITAERVRQIVEQRESAIATSGLRFDRP